MQAGSGGWGWPPLCAGQCMAMASGMWLPLPGAAPRPYVWANYAAGGQEGGHTEK